MLYLYNSGGQSQPVRLSPEQQEAMRRQLLIGIADQQPDLTASVAAQFSVSRQTVAALLRRLIDSGLVAAEGATKARRLRLLPLAAYTATIEMTPQLEEHAVWRAEIAPRLEGIPGSVRSICEFGFNEMLNNVISHAECSQVSLVLIRNALSIALGIYDNGIGIFRKIQQASHLNDPREAFIELGKGKLTTDPRTHTGEGIFFTSRMFDGFIIVSGGLHFAAVPGPAPVSLLDQAPPGAAPDSGTIVSMHVSVFSNRTPGSVFDQHGAEFDEYGFSRTIVPVHLAQFGGDHLVSRSQGRRVTARLEQFREVVLDFAGVDEIGQAFADEIFRVFHQEHPEVKLTYVNAAPALERMIRRAQHANPG